MMRPKVCVLVLFILLPLGLFAAPDEGIITAGDLLKINQLSSPALSPDGRTVIYVNKTIFEKPDKKGELAYRTQLWLASTDGQTSRALTQGDDGSSSPQWSPDGSQLAFVRAVKGKAQIFILPMQGGGEAWQLTRVEQGAANPRWSPDGKQILFTADFTLADVRKLDPSVLPAWSDERPARTFNDTANWSDKEAPKDKQPKTAMDGSLAERREWLAKDEVDANPRVTTRLNFLGEGDLDPLVTISHVLVIDVKEGAKPRDLTPGYVIYNEAEWIDDQQIVLVGQSRLSVHPDRDLVSSLYTVKSDGTGLRLLRESKDYALFSPRPSPDGKTIAFLTQPARDISYGQSVVGLAAIEGKEELRLVTASLDRSAGNLQWAADGQSLYFTAPTNGGFPLYRVNVTGTPAVSRLTRPDEGVTAYDLSRAQLAYVLTKPANPFELYAASPTAENPRVLTTHNSAWLKTKTLSQPEYFPITRPDGFKIDAWVMKPPHFDAAKKYPLLLEIHGGPSAMWGPGEASSWHEFQFFTGRGYVVVYSNPRGSGGYGYKFQKGNFQNWGVGPGGDVLAAADHVANEAWIDRDRQVVTGGSYGGYLTAWILTQDHRFKAAVAQRGVYDLTTFFGEGNAWRLVPEHFGGYPWEPKIREVLEANSPFTFVDKITTPLLIKHGDNDLRTGFVQSEMLFKALKVLDRPVEYVRYPRATHELSRSGEPQQRLDRLVRFEEFFRRYIGEN